MDAGRGYWTKFARARISRRRALASGAAIGAAATAIALVGCSDDKPAATATAPKRGGVLRTGTTLPLSSGLDPQIEQGTGLAIFPRLYGYMFHVDPRDDSIIQDHAASIEQPDPVTLIVKLHPGITFHDIAPVHGRAVTSDDVAASIIRQRDNSLVTDKTWHATILDHVDAPDAATVRVVTKRPYAYTMQELGAIGGGAILPRELIDAYTDLTSVAIGSGPFQLERSSMHDGARIVRNDAYFGAPLPYLDAMEWTIYQQEDDKLAAFKRHDVDAIPNHDAAEARDLRAFSQDLSVDGQPALASLSLGLRVDSPPFADPRVRGAIDLALDRDAMIAGIGLGEGDTLGPVNPHLAGGYWSLTAKEVDEASSRSTPIDERRADAMALLQAAGASGASFRMQVASVPELIDLATVVRLDLQKIGLQVAMDEIDLLSWFTNFRRGLFESTLISHLPYEWPDAPTRLYHSGGLDGHGSPFGFADADIDRLVERSWGEMDRDTRRSTLLDAQRLMVHARPMLQLFSGVGYSSTWNQVQGRRPELVGSLAQYNYSQWIAAS